MVDLESNDTIRGFVAVRVNWKVEEELDAARGRMVGVLPPDICAKFRPETGGYHVTLRFIGDMTLIQARSLGIRDPVSGVSMKMLERPFGLNLGGLGCFPSEDQGPPTVLFCEIIGNVAELKELQAWVEQQVSAAGFPPADFSFHPHITLGRFRDLTEKEGQVARRKIRREALAPASTPWTVQAVALLKSVRWPEGGVTYNVSDLREGQ